jgi:hypothetical protein
MNATALRHNDSLEQQITAGPLSTGGYPILVESFFTKTFRLISNMGSQ